MYKRDSLDTLGRMGSDDACDEPSGRPRAVLRPGGVAPFTVTRRPPAADLAYWVDYLWIVRWNATEPYVQEVIPQPVVHVVAEDGRMSAHGVGDSHFSRTLRDQGQVVGIAFRAGGFRGFYHAAMNTITRSVRTLDGLLGIDDREIARRMLTPCGDAELTDATHSWLRDLEPVRDPVIGEMSELVAYAEHDASMTRAEELARHAGVSVRTLQRQFGEYVGIGPKWVIQRFRLLDAAAVAHRGEPVDWADVAAALGFSDQAHLTRAFTRIVGTPPATYVRTAT